MGRSATSPGWRASRGSPGRAPCGRRTTRSRSPSRATPPPLSTPARPAASPSSCSCQTLPLEARTLESSDVARTPPADEAGNDEENENEHQEHEGAGPRALDRRLLREPEQPVDEERQRVLLAAERVGVVRGVTERGQD